MPVVADSKEILNWNPSWSAGLQWDRRVEWTQKAEKGEALLLVGKEQKHGYAAEEASRETTPPAAHWVIQEGTGKRWDFKFGVSDNLHGDGMYERSQPEKT